MPRSRHGIPNASRPATIGCDLGGTNVKVVLLAGKRVRVARETPTPRDADASAIVARLVDVIREVRDAGAAGAGTAVASVGVAVPGFLDDRRSTIVRLSNLPALDGVPLRRQLERRLRLPVRLDADTNAGAIGEALLGAGRPYRRVLYLTVGTGLGAAFVVDGRPLRVSRHTIGQVAHIPLGFVGRRCACGERSCAEAQLCALGILWRARRRGLPNAVSPQELYDRAETGKPGSRTERRLAESVWKETGELLGELCVVLSSLLSPDVMVVGGGIASAGDAFLPTARRVVDRRVPRRLGRTVALELAALRPFSGAVGAALLAGGVPTVDTDGLPDGRLPVGHPP